MKKVSSSHRSTGTILSWDVRSSFLFSELVTQRSLLWNVWCCNVIASYKLVCRSSLQMNTGLLPKSLFLLGEKRVSMLQLDTWVPGGVARLWDSSSGTQWGRWQSIARGHKFPPRCSHHQISVIHLLGVSLLPTNHYEETSFPQSNWA